MNEEIYKHLVISLMIATIAATLWAGREHNEELPIDADVSIERAYGNPAAQRLGY